MTVDDLSVQSRPGRPPPEPGDPAGRLADRRARRPLPVRPTLGEVFSSWPRLAHLDPVWMRRGLAAESISVVCVWWLHQAGPAPGSWFVIATSQLAGNALSRVVPAGAAAGATLQYRMPRRRAIDPPAAGSALTAVALMQLATPRRHPGLGLSSLSSGDPSARACSGGVDGARRIRLLVGVGAVLVLSDTVIINIGAVIQGRGTGSAAPPPADRGASPSGCGPSATSSSGRSGNAGRPRCWPRSGSGRSTTRAARRLAAVGARPEPGV